jgi:hypothetical protein
MYKHIDVIGAAECAAVAAALIDRGRYRPFLEAAEKLATRSGLVVCGSAARRMLFSSSKTATLNDFHYDFYTGRGFLMARDLADVLYKVDPNGLGHYTTLVTNIPYLSWDIMVDGRPMFTVTALTARARDVCTDSRAPALFSRDLQIPVVSRELALLDIYRELCDPAQLSNAMEALAAEAALRTHVLAAQPGVRGDSAAQSSRLARPVAELRESLLENFVTGAGRLLVGAAALAPSDKTARLQVITENDFDAEAETVAMAARHFGLEVRAHAVELDVPGDPRLRRLTLFVEGKDRQTAVLDLFNLASYELVPAGLVTDKSLQNVAAPFVIMRLLMVELWLSNFDSSASARKESRARVLAAYAQAARLLDAPPEAVLPTDRYIGRAEGAKEAFKRKILAAAAESTETRVRVHAPYMPAANANASANANANANANAKNEVRTLSSAKARAPISHSESSLSAEALYLEEYEI